MKFLFYLFPCGKRNVCDMHIAAGIGQNTFLTKVNNYKVIRLSDVGKLLDYY